MQQDKQGEAPQCLTPDSSKVQAKGVELAFSPDSESEDELPSPSTFVRVHVPKTGNDTFKRGGQAGKRP